MKLALSDLPKDTQTLHQMIRDLVEVLEQKSEENDRLRHQIESIKKHLYGKKSEKITGPQLLFEYAGLLMEMQKGADETPDEDSAQPEEKEKPPRARKKKKRLQIKKVLPIEKSEYELSDEKCTCEKCGGTLKKMGEEVTKQLDYRPASFYIHTHVRFKYSCPCCKESIVLADMPSQPIEKGLAGPGLLANILVNKYCDHLPLYRQEQIYQREGIELPRQTMCDWIAGCATLLQPIYDWMKKDLLASVVINTDDTPVRVQDQNREGTRQGRFWVYVGDRNHPQVLYDYTPNRCREGPLKFLEDYRGYLQADAYPGYDALYRSGDVIEVGCMAHCRRKFWDAQSTAIEAAHVAIGYIGCLYRIEREAKEEEEKQQLTGEDQIKYRYTMRQEKAVSIVNEFHEWLLAQEKKHLPKSPMGEAIHYALAQWDALTRYLSDGRLSIDNNIAEQNIRPIAVGRKNWLFCGSDNGGDRAAIIYSLAQTCKRHGVNPFNYFRDVLERIADFPINQIHQLTPLAWKESQLQDSDLTT